MMPIPIDPREITGWKGPLLESNGVAEKGMADEGGVNRVGVGVGSRSGGRVRVFGETRFGVWV